MNATKPLISKEQASNEDLFNVSGEFEDINIVISRVSNEVEMSVVARRC